MDERAHILGWAALTVNVVALVTASPVAVGLGMGLLVAHLLTKQGHPRREVAAQSIDPGGRVHPQDEWCERVGCVPVSGAIPTPPNGSNGELV